MVYFLLRLFDSAPCPAALLFCLAGSFGFPFGSGCVAAGIAGIVAAAVATAPVFGAEPPGFELELELELDVELDLERAFALNPSALGELFCACFVPLLERLPDSSDPESEPELVSESGGRSGKSPALLESLALLDSLALPQSSHFTKPRLQR